MVGECLVGWMTIGAHHRLICVTNGCTLINITGVINSAPQTINSDRQDDQIMVKVTTARWVVVIRMIIQDVALLMVTFSMIVAVDRTEITTSKINLTWRKSSDQEGNKMMT